MDTRQSESCKFKEIAKIQMLEFFTKRNARHTFWSLLISCVNMKWVRLVLWKIHSGHDSVHRRTDGQTSKVKPVYTHSTSLSGGITKKSYEMDKTAENAGHREVRWIWKTRIDSLIMDIHNWVLTIIRLWLSMVVIRNYWYPKFNDGHA